MLGTGEWTVQVTRRGGGAVYYQLTYDSISGDCPLDNTGRAQVHIPTNSKNIDALNDMKTWRDEIAIYRDDDLAFVGPLIQKSGTKLGGATLACQDMFHWLEKRFIEDDMVLTADVAENFSVIFNKALEPDNSMNLEIHWHEVGVREVMHIIGKEFTRAADLLRGLARTALDFSTIGRMVYVGGEEIYTSIDSTYLSPLVLHDGGVIEPDITEDGAELATDVAVFGEAVFVGSGERIFGRARRHVEDYGLVQTSFAEPAIKNTDAATANALSRLGQMYPVPLRGQVALSPKADFEFKEILPGRRVDARLSEETSLIPLMQEVRLAQRSFDVRAGEEKITLDLIPLGEREESFSAE